MLWTLKIRISLKNNVNWDKNKVKLLLYRYILCFQGNI